MTGTPEGTVPRPDGTMPSIHQMAQSSSSFFAQASDEVLVRGMLSDDDREWNLAWEEYYRRYVPQMISYAVRQFQQLRPCDCEDLVDEAVDRIRRGLGSFKWNGPNSLRAWCFTIVHHLGIDAVRKRKRWGKVGAELVNNPELMFPADSVVTGNGVDSEMLTQVRTVMASMSQAYQDVLRMSFLEMMSNEEIAETMGQSPAWVAKKKYEAIQSLRKRLAAVQSQAS